MRGVTMALATGAVIVLLAAALYLRSSGEPPAPPPTNAHAQPQASPRALERSARVEERLGQLRDDYDHRQGGAAALPEPNKRGVPTMAPSKKLAAQQPDPDDDDDDPEEIESLKNTLFTNPDPDERIGAVLMLSGEDGPESLRLLVEAMTDNDPEVRLAVVEALGDRSDELTPDTLAPAIGDPDPEVRFEGVSILGDMETPEALQMVRNALNDQDEDVRSLAEGIVDMADEDQPGAPQQAAPAPAPHK